MGTEASGTLHTIFETKQVSERFSKREFVIEINDNPKYPQLVLFQLTGDRCPQLDGFSPGDKVKLEYSLRGREWKSPSGETKYFNSLDCWSVESAGRSQSRGGSHEPAPSGGGGYGGEPGPDGQIPFASCELAMDFSPIAKVLR